MGKLFWLSAAIIVFPFLRLRYLKIFRDIKIRSRNTIFRLTNFLQKIGAMKIKIRSRKSRRTNKFVLRFIEHFHPVDGEFHDKELRSRVYNFLINSVNEGTNYRSLYRKTAAALHPDSAVNSRLMRAELEILFKYFQNNFTHPDKF